MRASGHQAKAFRHGFRGLGLWKDTPPDADNRIAGQDVGWLFATLRASTSLLHRKPQRVLGGKLATTWSFINVGGFNAVGDDPDLSEKLAAARAGTGKDQWPCRDHTAAGIRRAGSRGHGAGPI
jgi:hypothetical protein